jgi:hypothetical protein
LVLDPVIVMGRIIEFNLKQKILEQSTIYIFLGQCLINPHHFAVEQIFRIEMVKNG